MKTVWKFEHQVDDRFTVEIPKGAALLKVGSQVPHWITIWALVDSDAPKVQRTFRVVGTGNSAEFLSDGYIGYVGTAFDDPFVWHVFAESE